MVGFVGFGVWMFCCGLIRLCIATLIVLLIVYYTFAYSLLLFGGFDSSCRMYFWFIVLIVGVWVCLLLWIG